MRTAARIGPFVAVLGVAFGAAALGGAALDPLRDGDDSGDHHATETAGHGGDHGSAAAAQGPPGLAVAEQGYRLVPETTVLPLGRRAELAFRILGPDGRAIEDPEVEHERRMHLIVVRRDLTGYQHLHPALGAGGRWSVPVRLPAAGVYRAYADFRHDGRSLTLATDLFVPGPFAPAAIPPAREAASAGGYRVALEAGRPRAGADATLAYRVTRGGRPVTDIEPYLGADGHLVALREGDLAFLHVHPEEGHAYHGQIHFGASFPSAGRYRLFLQLKHQGRVRTVAHTLEVAR